MILNDGNAYLQEERDDLKAQLACFWETESIGVKGESAVSRIYDNKGFLRSIQHDGTRYSVDLPWTAEKEQLLDHEKLCEDRALRLHERLKRNPELMEKYDEMMKEQLKTGVLEPVPEKDSENKGGTVHVLPHHPVVREDKSTTKVRVVYDGSEHTKDNQVSINHCLELLGAVLLARLMVTVFEGSEGIVIDNVHCWTDSMTVLCWIQNVKYWGQYASIRVDEIRRILPVSVWNHVPGAENPADLPSRGVSGYQLVNLKLWWKGPNFLELNEKDWPSKGVLVPVLSDADALKELRKDPTDTTHAFVSCDIVDTFSVGKVIKCYSFSSITR